MVVRSDEERWDAAQEGAELLREGSLDAAIAELERLCIEEPDNPYAYFFLGSAHFQKEDWDKALKAYLTAIEKVPGYRGAMLGAAHTLRLMGRTQHALRMAKEAERQDDNDPDVQYLLGSLHFQRGEPAAAKQYLERFLQSRPEVEVALEVEGMLQVLAGQVVPYEEDEDTDV